MRSRTKTGTALTALLTTFALVGCAPELAPASDGPIHIVASTNVYGDIAATVGGDLVKVTSVISDPSQDPHSFEADARVQLALSKAHIVVENGGGYDPFVDQLLESLDTDGREVIRAVDEHDHDHSVNEHVWYDVATVGAVAAEIRDALVKLDPENSAAYEANTDELQHDLDALIARTAELKSSAGSIGVAVTEPVALYLLEALGMKNITPPAFSEAVEEGSEVSAATLNTTLRLFDDGDARILVYNEQTISPETEALKAAAVKAGAPVVAVTELLPEGTHYFEWMSATLDDLQSAIAGAQ